MSANDARRLELAFAWDRVEQDLWNRDVWAFACGDSVEDRPTRITLLLEALAGPGEEGERPPPYHTFHELQRRAGGTREGAEKLWEDILDLHGLLMGWFSDAGIYNKVGYLVAVDVPFATIVRAAAGLAKSEFDARLTELIRERLDLAPSDVPELSYERHADAIHRLLLLVNVEQLTGRSGTPERYPFARHAERRWSLEHIHAQNSEPLVRAEQWETWLVEHLEALEKLPPTIQPGLRRALVDRLRAARGKLGKETYPPLAAAVSDFFTAPQVSAAAPELEVHGIANMALLDRDDNASLNNAAFEVNRRRVLDLDRQGRFLPPCTRHVFLKYYSAGEGLQPHLWGPSDREAYLAAILKYLSPYLREEEVEP